MVYLYVGIGGIIGSVIRYLFSILSLPVWKGFPGGTLSVNLLGAFILGWFVSKVLPNENIPSELKTGISTGILGSFTTFSALSLESMQLISESQFWWLAIYVSISIVCGIGLAALGYQLGKRKLNEAKSK